MGRSVGGRIKAVVVDPGDPTLPGYGLVRHVLSRHVRRGLADQLGVSVAQVSAMDPEAALAAAAAARVAAIKAQEARDRVRWAAKKGGGGRKR